MSKIRLTFNIVVEYEPNPAHYPDCTTVEQMLAVDLKGAEDDPFQVIDSPNASWTTTGEVIE